METTGNVMPSWEKAHGDYDNLGLALRLVGRLLDAFANLVGDKCPWQGPLFANVNGINAPLEPVKDDSGRIVAWKTREGYGAKSSAVDTRNSKPAKNAWAEIPCSPDAAKVASLEHPAKPETAEAALQAPDTELTVGDLEVL